MDDSASLDSRLNRIEGRLARLEAGAGLPHESDPPRRPDRAEPEASSAVAQPTVAVATAAPPASEPSGIFMLAPLVRLEPEPPAPVRCSAAAEALEATEAPLASRLLDASRASGAREATAPAAAPPVRPARAPVKS